MDKICLEEKFGLFNEHWQPRIIAELNGQAVKLVKVKGDFVWHHHDDEDELFFVVKGSLTMHFRNEDVVLHPGEMIVVPRGIEHLPSADVETWLMLFEPTHTVNTGNVQSERTVENPSRI